MRKWLKPHWLTLSLAFLAAAGETLADVLQPWPLKIVLDNVLHHHGAKGNAWLNNLVVSIAGTDQWAVLKVATLAALFIAVFGAIIPLLHPFFPAAALAETVAPRCTHPRYAAAGYHEPSVVFLFGMG